MYGDCWPGIQIILHISGRGLGHLRDLYNFWHTIEHIFKTIWARDFKFGTQLWLTIAIWLSGSAYYSLLRDSTVGYPSDSLASCHTLCSEKNTHLHFLSYLHELFVDLNKNCSEYT